MSIVWSKFWQQIGNKIWSHRRSLGNTRQHSFVDIKIRSSQDSSSNAIAYCTMMSYAWNRVNLPAEFMKSKYRRVAVRWNFQNLVENLSDSRKQFVLFSTSGCGRRGASLQCRLQTTYWQNANVCVWLGGSAMQCACLRLHTKPHNNIHVTLRAFVR